MAKHRPRTKSPSMLKPIDAYDYAYKTRNLEIRLFWQRSNYFLVLNTAIATGIILQGLEPNPVSIALAIFGIIVSILWYGVNIGGKFWQTRWEYKLSQIEREVAPHIHLFNTDREETIDDVATDLAKLKDRTSWQRFIDRGILTKPSVSRNMITL